MLAYYFTDWHTMVGDIYNQVHKTFIINLSTCSNFENLVNTFTISYVISSTMLHINLLYNLTSKHSLSFCFPTWACTLLILLSIHILCFTAFISRSLIFSFSVHFSRAELVPSFNFLSLKDLKGASTKLNLDSKVLHAL